MDNVRSTVDSILSFLNSSEEVKELLMQELGSKVVTVYAKQEPSSTAIDYAKRSKWFMDFDALLVKSMSGVAQGLNRIMAEECGDPAITLGYQTAWYDSDLEKSKDILIGFIKEWRYHKMLKAYQEKV